MADAKISALDDAGALAGTEQIPVNDGGTTRRTTTQEIADLASVSATDTLNSVTETDDFTLGSDHYGKRTQVAKTTGEFCLVTVPDDLDLNKVMQVRWDDDAHQIDDGEPETKPVYFTTTGDVDYLVGEDHDLIDIGDGIIYALDGPGSTAEVHCKSVAPYIVEITGPVVPRELPDITPPVLSSPTGTETSETTATGTVSTDKGNGQLYFVTFLSSQGNPTATQIEAGTDEDDVAAPFADNQAVIAIGEQDVAATGLTDATAYKFAYVQRSATNVQSNVVVSAEFTTGAVESASAQFLARVAAQDGTHEDAYIALIDGLVAAGIWTKLDALYIFAAAEEATALENLRQDLYNATAVSAPTFTADEGFTGATGDSVDTGFNPTTASSPEFIQDDAVSFAWSLTSAGIAGAIFGSAGGMNRIYPRYTDNTAYLGINRNSTFAAVSQSDGSGLVALSRTGASAAEWYKNGVSQGTNAGASSAPDNQNFTFLVAESVEYVAGQCAGGGFGSALSDTEQSDLYDLLLAYLQAVGAVP